MSVLYLMFARFESIHAEVLPGERKRGAIGKGDQPDFLSSGELRPASRQRDQADAQGTEKMPASRRAASSPSLSADVPTAAAEAAAAERR